MDRTDEILEFFAKKELDALVSVGGDGSLTIANALHLKGLRVVGVPKTIDNDLDKTFTTFGFDTAVGFATECLDRLHSTAESHQRVMVVEVMGRYAGWIALHAGIAGSVHAILIPEIPFDLEKVAAKIRARDSEGRMYSIVVVAEGAEPAGGHRAVAGARRDRPRRAAGRDRRKNRQGTAGAHRTRTPAWWCWAICCAGAAPLPSIASRRMRFGTAAVRALAEGQSGVMVALAFPNVNYVALEDVAGRMKGVPLDCDTLQTGRDMGICFGD